MAERRSSSRARQWMEGEEQGPPGPPRTEPPVGPRNLEERMRDREGPSEYLRDLDRKRPQVADHLWFHDPSRGGFRWKSPLEVLKAHDQALAKDIEENMEDLKGAFDRAWSTLDPPRSLHCWGEALGEVGCSEISGENLADLAAESAMGRAEASRILVHFWKQGPSLQNPGKYLHTAISGAWDYLRDWRAYEASVPDLGRGPEGWGRWRNYRGPQERPEPEPRPSDPPAPPPATSEGASSSSNAWASYRPSTGWTTSYGSSWGEASAPWER